MATAVKPVTPRLRADATRNRERIIVAALEIFVEDGPEAPLDEIARRAGVGNATLYRNFADRSELIRQVTISVFTRTAEQAESALAEEPDGFTALRRFVHAAADERVGAVCPMLAARLDKSDPKLLEGKQRLETAIRAIMDRARGDGQLRADVDAGDLFIAITQLSRPLPGTACLQIDHFVHRHLQIFLDGLQAPARSELPGRAATLEDIKRSV